MIYIKIMFKNPILRMQNNTTQNTLPSDYSNADTLVLWLVAPTEQQRHEIQQQFQTQGRRIGGRLIDVFQDLIRRLPRVGSPQRPAVPLMQGS